MREVARGGRSLTDVLTDIFRNVEDILRSEIRLAQSEVREELRRNRPAGLWVVAGLVGAIFSVFFLLLAILYGLRMVLPGWAAALCMAVALAIVAVISLQVGRARLRQGWGARKEHSEWTKPGTR